MVKSERKFANDVTINVPRSVLEDGDEKSTPMKKVGIPLWGALHPDEGLGPPFPIRFVPRDVLVRQRATVLSP